MKVGKRDVLFVGLVCGGALVLGANLFSNPAPLRPDRAGRVAPALADPEIVAQVDRAFAAQWSDDGLTPAPPAPELAVMRRLALALTGSVPSVQEVRRFESRPAATRQALGLDDLLHDRRTADYLAERLARVYVGTEGGPFIIYRRRRFVTWLSDELMQNRPYDRIVRQLIADEGIWTDVPATNFISVTIEPNKGPDPERLGARVARAFLGARIDCAQCHDHPFEPWKQRDFQGLSAFFGQVQSGLTGIHDDPKGKYEPNNRRTGTTAVMEPRVPFLPELLPADGSRRLRLARWLTDPKNPYLARATVNRMWALLLGRPLVEPIDNVVAAGDPPETLQLLADDFSAHGYDLRRLVRVIVATRVFQLDSLSAAEADPTGAEQVEACEKAWSVFPITRLRPEQVVGGVFQADSLLTINRDSNIFVRLGRSFGESAFVQRYGDTGDDEFDGKCGTIPQRLLMLNGDLVHERTRDDLGNAGARIALFAPSDKAAVETAYLAVLTRRPTPEEAVHFEAALNGLKGMPRRQRLADLCWTLVNSTEFSWNH